MRGIVIIKWSLLWSRDLWNNDGEIESLQIGMYKNDMSGVSFALLHFQPVLSIQSNHFINSEWNAFWMNINDWRIVNYPQKNSTKI